ncbi:hypothetical protein [Paraburkholderia xenovorans]|uniref:hypothetical protein n=1 Tax=Paraburkholderia xenovorans TaxID=36873 RepID=UPI0020A69236|nr:hypothetical protein [Paraburkholderia xenovorans]
MSKIGKNTKPASRPPVEAVQYEKLALSAFGSCERQLTQLNRLATLATSIYRNPALTNHERRSRQVLLELLVETCERVMYDRLRLTVNETKSAVASVSGRQFLGYSLWVAPGSTVRRGVAAGPLLAFKRRIRELTRRNGGRSMQEVVERLRPYGRNPADLAYRAQHVI